MKKMLFIKFSSNYADEFDLSGFVVMPEKEWEKHKAGISKRFAALPKPPDDGHVHRGIQLEAYFGTNEFVGWETEKSYLSSFDVKELADAEYKLLKKLFGAHCGRIEHGMVAMLSY